MPSSYRFELAGEPDDCALRAVLGNTSMDGKPALSLQREPNFFTAEQAGNIDSQVIVARQTDNHAIVGLGSRSFRKMFINGEVKIGGYLSGLRGLPEVRGGTLLARGYKFLKELHADSRTPYYITTIFDDNDYARRVLTSRRAGLPVYRPLGRLNTYLMPLYSWRRRRPKLSNVRCRMPGDLLYAAMESLNHFNSRHQFAPWYTPGDFQGATSLLPGFELENLYGYQDGGNITATLGVWDQTSFKQLVVTDYAWQHQLVRPFFNAAALFGLTHRLPEVGRPILCLYGSFLSHAPQHLEHLESVLLTALQDWSGRGYAYFLLGVHEKSAVNHVLKRYAVKQKSSTVYLVYWEDTLVCPLPSTELVPHLEISTL